MRWREIYARRVKAELARLRQLRDSQLDYDSTVWCDMAWGTTQNFRTLQMLDDLHARAYLRTHLLTSGRPKCAVGNARLMSIISEWLARVIADYWQ